MTRKLLGLTAALVLVAIMPVAIAQTRRSQSPVVDQAQTALLEGRYDEVAGLLKALDARDPHTVLVARAAIARGRYQDAEATLRTASERAPTGDAALELGLLLQLLGRPEATAILERISATADRATDPADLARAGRALRALGKALDANAVYRDAAAAAPRDPAIQTAWGDLFLDNFKANEAVKSYQDALKANPRYEPAILGLARALSDDDPPEARKMAKQALEINPSNVATHVFLAEEAVDAGHRDEARKSLQLALDINPNSLDARSLLAGLNYIEDKSSDYDAELAKVLALNPKYGEAYRVVAEIASHNFRYEEALVLARRAVELDPRNPRILADFGIHLLRIGDEVEARRALEESFSRDDLNLVTFNLLQMLDTLDKFVTVRDNDIILKMDKSEAPVIGDFAMALAHQALDTMSKRYGFTPKGPILIEIFPKHDDFAVRIAGLPGMVGALGVCFGRVVSMDSPHAAPPGTFQWEATLWHELAHVITLQMSNYRIPRWLTEGISEYEENVQRKEWRRGMEESYAAMLNTSETLKLVDLNAAFTNPRTINLAYYEATLLVRHIVETYGDEGLHKLLRAYGTGLETDAALRQALNTSLAEMQGGFDQTIDKMFGKLRVALQTADGKVDFQKMSIEELGGYADAHKDSYGAQMLYADALRKAKRDDDALPIYERAAALVPVATGDDSPQMQIVDIALQKKDTARAITGLEAVVEADVDNVAAARKLASLLREANVTDAARLRPVYQRIIAIDPFDGEAHSTLGKLLMQSNQPQAAVRNFKAVVALKPVDQAAAYTDLAESYFKSGQRAEARRQTLAALEIAPSYERAQNLLLEIAGSRP